MCVVRRHCMSRELKVLCFVLRASAQLALTILLRGACVLATAATYKSFGKFDTDTNVYSELTVTSPELAFSDYWGAVAVGTFVYFVPYVSDPPPPRHCTQDTCVCCILYVSALRRTCSFPT